MSSLQRDSLKILDEALTLLEQGFAAMLEFKVVPGEWITLTPLPPGERRVRVLSVIPAKAGIQLQIEGSHPNQWRR